MGGANTITDLNGHINYANASLPQAQRQLSIGDPRAIVWKADGSKAYITGMGSNNVVMINCHRGADRIDRSRSVKARPVSFSMREQDAPMC